MVNSVQISLSENRRPTRTNLALEKALSLLVRKLLIKTLNVECRPFERATYLYLDPQDFSPSLKIADDNAAPL